MENTSKTYATAQELNVQPFLAKKERPPSIWRSALRHWGVRIGAITLLALAFAAIFAPYLGTVDPSLFDSASRNLLPGAEGDAMNMDGELTHHVFIMGSDSLGRDIYSRVLYGTRVSLAVGVSTALVAVLFGTLLGLCAGFIRWTESPIMRVMDGLMAIPSILIAISLVALWRGGLIVLIIAIAIPEIPRVARLIRALVLSLREEPYVEAAISLGTPTLKIMWRHIFPNTIAPILVQGTFICATGILLEAVLSFLGIGLPPEIPSWGTVMAEGRTQFNEFPHNILFPGIALALAVLAVNVLGDGLRDTMDPKLANRK